MAAAEPETYFICEECPLSEECNTSNFQSWKPWGCTDEECRSQVLTHLLRSGRHKDVCSLEGDSKTAYYESLVATIPVVEKPWDEGKAEGAGPKRRRRGGGGGGGGGGGSSVAASNALAANEAAERLQTTLEGLNNLVQQAADAAAGAAPAKGGGKGRPAVGNVGGAIGAARSSSSQALVTSTAVVQSQELQEVMDSLGRCVTSARHAQRLSAMAAQAFADEATVFENVRDFIRAKLDTFNR